MKKIILLCIIIVSKVAFSQLKLSKKIFREVPYSSQYSEDGALIRSVDFKSVNALNPQLEKKYKKRLQSKKLEDRNEAHITVITPPEGRTGFFPNSIGIDKVLSIDSMIDKYKNKIQATYFDVLCVGMQSNDKDNIVFYLVVESKDILNIRNEIAGIISSSNRTDIPFEPVKNYYPHITIGYIGGDVHGVSKGKDTCVEKIQLY